tara:strand:+ start:986 stop:2371 length:1386 start_codon:yes stop_codon:yes gene_type:complete
MFKSKHFGLIFLLLGLATVSSCKKEVEVDRIFFGGQIVNPSSTYVTLYKDNKTIDSLPLNLNYRFFKYYDSLDSGIYKIEHIPEYKSVFLEKGDSIWARINASSFNESIVYSGRGSAKNNFMMDLLLSFEKENSFLSSKYSSDSKTFTKLIDSLLIEKKNKWILMDSINQLSPIAQKITQAAYIYPYATRKVRYALLRGTFWNKKQDSIYFDFRKYLSLAETDLAFFDPYINYLLNYLSKKALDSTENYFINRQKTNFNIKRLQLIRPHIKGNVLINNLSRALAFEELMKTENHDHHEKFLQNFLSVNTSKSYVKEVLDLHNDIEKMSTGNKLPKLKLQNHQLDIIDSDDLIEKPTVFYFWSQTQMSHYRNTVIKAKALEELFPKYEFKGVCIQPFNEIVFQVHRMMGIDPKTQFAFTNFDKDSKKWVLSLLNRAIVVNTDGKIKEGFGNFSATDFADLLR